MSVEENVGDSDTCKINTCLKVLEQECKELLYYSTNVPTISAKIDPLHFLREFVSKNQPVLIKGGCKHWPAINKWNMQYFRSQLGNKRVTVAVTPNGLADAVFNYEGKKWFVLPEEVDMSMLEFLDNIEKPRENYVCYMQRQNSNLTEEMSELLPDVRELIWAEKVFGKPPDAVNFWMGDERAVTSMHKDPYENLYCVVDGWKEFTLVPAVQLPLVPYENYPVAEYSAVMSDTYRVKPVDKDNKVIPWISTDPRKPELPNASVHQVTVQKGDCLYLPALWFHHVTQSHGCIAVNYWYDMEYDVKYCYHKMLEKMTKFVNK